MGIFRQVIRTTRGVGRAILDVNRLREILQVLMSHGFGHLVGHVMLGGAIAYQAGLVPGKEGFFTRARRSIALLLSSFADLLTTMLSTVGLWKRSSRAAEQVPARGRARNALVDLGPTFVKVGQILSTRPDLIPDEWCEEFSSLQDRVDPLPIETIEKEIATDLGKPTGELLYSFDSEPLASASIAQVHRARLYDGREVVAKVRRPGVLRSIVRDLEIIKFLARSVEAQFPEVRVIDAQGILNEIEKSVRSETNFLVEAGHIQRMRENFEGFDGIRIPEVIDDCTNAAVLTMEYLDGIPLREAREAGHDMKKLGKAYLQAAFKMLFEDGFFHGDLHPGNVLVLKDGSLGLIDFGMVGRLSEEMTDQIVAVVLGLQRRDFRTIARIFYEIGIKEVPVNYQLFEQDVMEIMDQIFVGRAMADIQIGAFLRELAAGCIRHHVRMPPSFTMLLKALVTTEGLAKTLIPEINPLQEMAPYIEKLAARRFSAERLQRDLLGTFAAFSTVTNRAPVLISQMMDDYQAGRMQIPVVMQTPKEELELRERSVNRIIMALIVVSLILGSSVSLLDHSLRPFGLPLLPSFGFLLAFSTWCVLLYGIWRSRKI